ncbi:MAG: carboxylesterase family protein [Myxococcales bacterium]|nr:carboxylesterase family protein [Myxococcales bacterium]MCB9713143.1 carboxylesterase family protein [Myxococcales bacterium]
MRTMVILGSVATAWLLIGCGDDGGAGAGGSSDAGTTDATAPTDGTTTAADGTGSSDDDGSELTDTGPVDECETMVQPGGTVVLTEHGPVDGVDHEGVVAYLGVPFAAPPVGELRWQPPQDPACWTETRLADEPGPGCAQLESEDGPVVGDEDCLHLNLWTPGPGDDAMRPVMVFIHGGGHALGYGADPLFDGTRLAREHDVVVVTIDYRLGALGYLAHDLLDARDPRGVSGNYGLLDQLHALRWVSRNAAAFGGDPGNVTVFGESAGAVSTCAVLGAPEAEGLVHRAIVQSGTCSQRSSAQYRGQVGDPWMDASTCTGTADPLQCLLELPFAAVVEAEPTGYPSVSALGQAWSPYVDGVTLPASTDDQMAAGEHVDVPFVVGANAEETASDSIPLDDAQYEALVAATFGPLAPLVLAQYPVSDYDSGTAAWIALSSDLKFICSARHAAEAATGGSSAVYRYHFSYDGYTTGPMVEPAAFHGLELVYVFGNFDAVPFGGLPYPINADDEAMAMLLGEAWTTFARTGDPSTAALAWPPYEAGVDPYAGLDTPPLTGAGVRTEQCDFWSSLAGG